MNYSITARGCDKAEVKQIAGRKLDLMLEIQPHLVAVLPDILANVADVVDRLAHDPARDIIVTFGGFTSMPGEQLETVSLGATASLVKRGYDPDAMPATPRRRAGD